MYLDYFLIRTSNGGTGHFSHFVSFGTFPLSFGFFCCSYFAVPVWLLRFLADPLVDGFLQGKLQTCRCLVSGYTVPFLQQLLNRRDWRISLNKNHRRKSKHQEGGFFSRVFLSDDLFFELRNPTQTLFVPRFVTFRTSPPPFPCLLAFYFRSISLGRPGPTCYELTDVPWRSHFTVRAGCPFLFLEDCVLFFFLPPLVFFSSPWCSATNCSHWSMRFFELRAQCETSSKPPKSLLARPPADVII